MLTLAATLAVLAVRGVVPVTLVHVALVAALAVAAAVEQVVTLPTPVVVARAAVSALTLALRIVTPGALAQALAPVVVVIFQTTIRVALPTGTVIAPDAVTLAAGNPAVAVLALTDTLVSCLPGGQARRDGR
jgi:hypothetical protein